MTNADRTDGVLARLADAMWRHRRTVIATWVVVLAVAIGGGLTLAGTHTVDYSTPGSDSKAASERLVQSFSGRSGESLDLVWNVADGRATAPAARERVERLLDEIETVPGIAGGTTTADAEVSDDGRTAIVRLPLDRTSGEVPDASGERIGALVAAAGGDGLKVAVNGQVNRLDRQAGGGEMFGVGVAAVVLLITFGAVVAAGLPIVLAAFGVAIAFLLGGILAAVIDTPDWASEVSIMIGLGVGIDYALLILTRYRAAVAGGSARREANVVAMTTAGHSVLVAGGSVVIALMGLFIMRLPYLYGVALAASLTVLVVLAVTLTLLPALLGVFGRAIDALPIPGLNRAPADPERTPSARWARAVVRRPVVAVVVSLVALALLAAPLSDIRFGFPDAGNNRADATTRQAYDLIAAGFGAGSNASLIAVADTPSAAARSAAERLRGEIGRDPGVVAVAPLQLNDARDTATIAITPRDGPSAPQTKALVERLRDGPLAAAGVDVTLGGDTAATVDQAAVTASRLPLFIGAVVVLSFLLLWRAFRAPVIALKAGLFTILSILAAYGVVAYVSEGGWAGQLIGIDSDLPVPPFIPVMMFAVTFGLAMDYEVFIVSRMQEERERLGDARAAVVSGLARTSKVITAAALIMVSVFGAFAFSSELILKLIGVGLASAILIDGILIRMVLLPGVMHLLGERAWWRPGGGLRRPAAGVRRG
ncbi:MMPL family transporter [Conexibacter sp. JD483]|uniref:MMPL family transporter n=1 Tax=unclassified Conexibacter TaxID=2627773 RepID=UPI00271D0EDF|nr:MULTISPECIES: MMPL family transporter [unclassified Conexibacter]MDO8189505.1 MMPL family transporter [Conexibacter sp. CPCC 205706]MDO8202087.1 MMPL family transporter [Conexibacter sp. CPCC 205762]MDR9372927.1 MMPL family transporter [Conexibacter sp. JD483]